MFTWNQSIVAGRDTDSAVTVWNRLTLSVQNFSERWTRLRKNICLLSYRWDIDVSVCRIIEHAHTLIIFHFQNSYLERKLPFFISYSDNMTTTETCARQLTMFTAALTSNDEYNKKHDLSRNLGRETLLQLSCLERKISRQVGEGTVKITISKVDSFWND